VSEFTDIMEAEAETIAEAMSREEPGWQREVDGRGNVKPWYSQLSAFQPGAKRALVGIDPGGHPSTPDDTVGPQYRRLLEGHSYNAFLDERWPKGSGSTKLHRAGEARLQRFVRKVFRILFPGSNPEEEIRATTCFNACPIRTGHGGDLPPRGEVWRLSKKWFNRVLEHIQPELIICIANGNVSPWQALSVSHSEKIRLAESAYLKCGLVELNNGRSVKVIGLPHVRGAYNKKYLYSAMIANRESLLGIEG